MTRPDAVEVLRAAAAAGSVLLTNNDAALPLSVEPGTRIAIIGPNAAVPCYQGGTFARVTIDPALPTPLQALRREFAHAEIRYEPGAIVEGISGLGGLNPIAPDGTPGVLVEYFTGTDPDHPAYSEVRPGSSFVWFNDIPGIGGPGDRGRVRLTAIVTAPIAGTYRLCVGGTGDATLSMDGRQLVQWPGPELSDVMGVVARADTAGAGRRTRGRPNRSPSSRKRHSPRVGSNRSRAGYYAPTPPDLLGAAETAARESDLVILVVGDNTSSSRESADRDNTSLGAVQVELIERVAAANPRTIVVVNASRSVDMPWVDKVVRSPDGLVSGPGIRYRTR